MGKSIAAQLLGQMGGHATSKKYGSEYMRSLASKGGKKSGESKRARKSMIQFDTVEAKMLVDNSDR